MNVERPTYEDLLALATDPATTPFDYVVVGSGAGGGTLAARLALAGKRVLLVEAGADAALAQPQDGNPVRDEAFKKESWREEYAVPGYHARSTEDSQMSWEFSTRHYDDDVKQRLDSKYNESKDPSQPSGSGRKGGIFYPRCASIGGCTSHYAMIVIKPNAKDWDEVAKLTGDSSWGSDNMEGYFARLEHCLYVNAYQGFLRKILGGIYQAWRWAAKFINPRAQLDGGGHGFDGWQTTSFIDPLLIAQIGRNDSVFRGILWDAIIGQWRLAHKSWGWLATLTAPLQVVRYLDPNFGDDAEDRRDRLSLIPIGTDGKRRTGVREHLLETAKAHPDRLVIAINTFARKVLFKPGAKAPKAVGIEVSLGSNLYDASTTPASSPETAKKRQYFARQEVILSGGTFNTPQLLMLSGIGDKADLARHGIDVVADLPGVGRNLQDRYEVSVISRLKKPLSTLSSVSFDPGDQKDAQRKLWKKDGSGLYATNGGALAIFTTADRKVSEDPDIFVFGFPAAFRGYYWRYSHELLNEPRESKTPSADLWSWVLLKAYSHNRAGQVRLNSGSPFEQPEICFHSFAEGSPEYQNDIDALSSGIRFVRELNAGIGNIASEIQPGTDIANGSLALGTWIEKEAWGHHACGTCRMGSDPWMSDATQRADKDAVLDSRFRVQGVEGLRVVDASAFPRIPGYFLVTSVFMIAEKAADVLLADSSHYPAEFEAVEAKAIRVRRKAALADPGLPGPEEKLPLDTVGLALSGGGIRSATFCLGVIQALAKKNRLRKIDMISSVSGGGYTGSFVGRLYTRLAAEVGDKAAQVQATLSDLSSAPLWWVRSHADYIGGNGLSDLRSNLGIFWRNLIALHVVVGLLLFAVLGGLAWLAGNEPVVAAGISASPWWWLPPAFAALVLAPFALAYWLAPRPGCSAPHSLISIVGSLTLLGAATAGLRFELVQPWAGLGIVIVLLAWLIEEAAHIGLVGEAPAQLGTLIRNRLTRALGALVILAFGIAIWVIVDSIALDALKTNVLMPWVGGALVGLLTLAPWMKNMPMRLAMQIEGDVEAAKTFFQSHRTLAAASVAIPVAALILVALDMAAHALYRADPAIGLWATAAAAFISLVIGRAVIFLNASSLHTSYAERLVRTFLGASNDARVYASAAVPTDIYTSDADDDLPWSAYHPEANAGPLHLINVCVNETADAITGRALREDKGLPMCVGPAGVNVSVRFHGLWTPETADGQSGPSITPIRVASDPNDFHVLAKRGEKTTAVEPLRLGQWMAISGAAFTTGLGYQTSAFLSLLLGLLNVRLGYWWNSGVDAGDRPGRYPPNLLGRLRAIPEYIFRVQSTLLGEWRGYFAGPSQRLWYLSDGGHFETTGIYELVRRRVPFIIAVDAGEDPQYNFGNLAQLTRKVRLDFGADLHWLDQPGLSTIPAWVSSWFNPEAIGPLLEIKQECDRCASVARIDYADAPGRPSWLLFIKAAIRKTVEVDVRNYAKGNDSFPNESTFDQIFVDEQWESYRCLGEGIGMDVFR